ncbi:CHAP domain-containing protein [Photobacterium ganghwense]|uniref:CHAP domain-containing protein n=1 Tax=Photobacterium ganghwense TaxID=320778 RepID=UPI0039EE0001
MDNQNYQVKQELIQKLLAVANGEVGVEEVPRGSNDGKRVREYLTSAGINVPAPWCMAFVYWCLQQVGVTGVPRTAHCGTMWNKAKEKRVCCVNNAQSGDVFIQIFQSGNGHAGIVEYVEGEYVYTIEGNTNDEGSREGYEVCRRKRHVSTMKGFLRFI